jgi:hypothetical protein
VRLLVSNKTLAEQRGKEIRWSTKVHELIPEWGLMEDEMDRGVTLLIGWVCRGMIILENIARCF